MKFEEQIRDLSDKIDNSIKEGSQYVLLTVTQAKRIKEAIVRFKKSYTAMMEVFEDDLK